MVFAIGTVLVEACRRLVREMKELDYIAKRSFLEVSSKFLLGPERSGARQAGCRLCVGIGGISMRSKTLM